MNAYSIDGHFLEYFSLIVKWGILWFVACFLFALGTNLIRWWIK